MLSASSEFSFVLQNAATARGTKVLRAASAALIAMFATSTNATAACTDTFDNVFVTAGSLPGGGPALSVQNTFPLGVGATMNALVSTMNIVNTAFLAPSSAFVTAKGEPQAGQLGGGVWGRAVVGTVETNSTTTSTIDASKAKVNDFNKNVVPHAPITGTGTCKGTVEEDYVGYQFGFDLAKLNFGGNGGNFHFGLTAGVISSNSKDTTSGARNFKAIGGNTFEFESPPGSFSADIQVPFIGLYAALTQGNFFADVLVRQDFYVMNLTDPLNGLSSQAQNATGISAGGSLGYRVPLPSNWFIEPSGGVIWSRVHVDSINVPGSATFQFLNVGSVKIDDIDSLLGRFSLRVGANITSGNVVWQPFVTGTVFHEFASNATAASTIAGPVDGPFSCVLIPAACPPSGFFINDKKDQVMSTSTSRIGTFTQVGIGTATVFGNSGWLAFGRADYRTGENVEGYSFNAGLRYNW
jgi:hypothetical protein